MNKKPEKPGKNRIFPQKKRKQNPFAPYDLRTFD